ncbi:MAG TPA: TIGR00725 family protein [Solirubrobacteraceae bacterium]|nr:TIGR00725 family protein [Solirubrobacteraceae bacterium]
MAGAPHRETRRASQHPYVAVIGASRPSEDDARMAEEVGRRLAEAGAHVVTGGRGGVMAAACRGAHGAGGTSVGLLPGSDRGEANEWATITIPTGLGELRNGLVVRAAEVVIAVGGAYGTLSEIGLALQAGKPVLGLNTWAIDGVERHETATTAVARALELAAGGRRDAA